MYEKADEKLRRSLRVNKKNSIQTYEMRPPSTKRRIKTCKNTTSCISIRKICLFRSHRGKFGILRVVYTRPYSSHTERGRERERRRFLHPNSESNIFRFSLVSSISISLPDGFKSIRSSISVPTNPKIFGETVFLSARSYRFLLPLP